MRVLNEQDLRRLAPSIYATEPWQAQSDKYRFIPTINVVTALQDSGFHPVRAMQSRSRVPGKAEFTKHMIRFRRAGDYNVNDIIPEIILVNSHDGTSAYKISMGLYRLVCSNGLTVADTAISNIIRFTHRGAHDLCREVIDVSAEVMAESPKVLTTVNLWKTINLTMAEQTAFAESVKNLNYSTIEIKPDSLLSARRLEDYRSKEDNTRDLWRTYNVVQENVIRGGVMGRTANNRLRRTRQIKSVDGDIKLNKALWTLAEKMAGIKNAN